MTDRLSPDEARKALREEHLRLHDVVVRMSGSRDLEDLVNAIEALVPLLRAHFAHEERPGGLYEAIGAVSPGFLDQAARLTGDHARFLATVTGLARQGRELLDVTHRRFFEEARELARGLHVHEGEEHALAAEASAGS